MGLRLMLTFGFAFNAKTINWKWISRIWKNYVPEMENLQNQPQPR